MKNTLCLLALLAAACSENSMLKSVADTAQNASGGGDSLDEDEADTGGLDLEPVWWSLGAHLVLKKGSLLPDSELSIVPRSEAGEALCEDPEPLVVSAAVEEASPYKEVLTWWRLTLAVPDALCDGISLPIGETLYLGVGEMHPDIYAAIETMDGLDGALPLNGAYASIDGAEVFVFGVAGHKSAYSGSGEVAESAPLEDGSWRVEPVYWFSY